MTVDPGPSPATPEPEESPELRQLRREVADLEQALEAIRSGDVDALVLGGGGKVQLYHRITTDRPYRVLVERMAAGMATLSSEGRILFANARLAEWLGCDRTSLVGRPLHDLVLPEDQRDLAAWLAEAAAGSSIHPLTLRRTNGEGLPVLLALNAVDIEALRVICLVAVTDTVADRPQPPPTPSQQPTAAALPPPLQARPRQGNALAISVGVLAVIVGLDLLVPQGAGLQALFGLPLLIAARGRRPRQIVGLGCAIVALLIVSGLRWGMVAEMAFWWRLLATVLLIPLTLAITGRRHHDPERRSD